MQHTLFLHWYRTECSFLLILLSWCRRQSFQLLTISKRPPPSSVSAAPCYFSSSSLAMEWCWICTVVSSWAGFKSSFANPAKGDLYYDNDPLWSTMGRQFFPWLATRCVPWLWNNDYQPFTLCLYYSVSFYISLSVGTCVKKDQETSYTIIKSKETTITADGLKPASAYIFQIRARTAAGYGGFSRRFEFETSPVCKSF